MRFSLLSFLLPALFSLVSADSDTPAKPKPPIVDEECTVTSPHSESFFDLRPLRRLPDHILEHHDWVVKGQDYGANFTINFCAPVLSETSIKEGGQNVSAFYEKDGVQYSIGSTSTTPKFRGRKLVLAYENGSPCPGAPDYRKSTLMSLMCDHEQVRKPSVAFVGQFNDCSYFFEVRTAAACATMKAQELGPVAVFAIIMGVFAVVYCVGGCMYQRTVMHARGWRQIPHWQAWSGGLTFLWNLVNGVWVFLVERLPLPSSFRRTPGGRRYAGGFGPRSVGGARYFADDLDAENRLIDELDD